MGLANVAAQVPLPTYFVGDYGEGAEQVQSLAAADTTGRVQLCENLFFLRGSGIKEIAGLRVAFLSGKYDKVCKQALRLPVLFEALPADSLLEGWYLRS